jgi:hypothetical protein
MIRGNKSRGNLVERVRSASPKFWEKKNPITTTAYSTSGQKMQGLLMAAGIFL